MAERALQHYEKYHEPIGRMVKADALEYAHRLKLGDSQAESLIQYLAHISKIKVTAPDSVTSKVTAYKRELLRSWALQELVEMRVDCDLDAVVVRARQKGPACHEGYRSCFYRSVKADGSLETFGERLMSPEEMYGSKS